MDDWTVLMAAQLLTEHTVAQAVRAAGIDVPPRYVEATGSTNSDLLRMASDGAPEWTVLVAGHQTAGRGRLGRSWESLPGSSLLVSVLLHPLLPPAEAPLLSLAAAAAMAGSFPLACGLDVLCKWPNDLLAGERKVGGILAEAVVAGGRLEHVVVGIGVNLMQAEEDLPPELRDRATSVTREGGRPGAQALLREYLRRYRDLYGTHGEGLAGRTLDPYRELCATLGRPVRATVAYGETTEGRALDVGPSGELFVETRTGVRAVAFGEIVHLG